MFVVDLKLTVCDQYEGAVLEDGRTFSIWDTFAHSGNMITSSDWIMHSFRSVVSINFAVNVELIGTILWFRGVWMCVLLDLVLPGYLFELSVVISFRLMYGVSNQERNVVTLHEKTSVVNTTDITTAIA